MNASPQRWAWIGGWGIGPDRFRAAADEFLPGYEHLVMAPTRDAIGELLALGADRIGGYSLGTLLVMASPGRFAAGVRVTCLAPILAFCSEGGRGGTTPRAALRGMQAKLRRKPEATLRLFYRLAGLRDEPLEGLPYGLDDLEWGLEALATVTADPPGPEGAGLPGGEGYLGGRDALIDAEALQMWWPGCKVAVPCSHNYRDLLRVLATDLAR